MTKLKLYVETSVFGFYYDMSVASRTVAGADVIVSCNLRHLANEMAARRFLAVNRRQGYGSSLSIRQPEEVIIYED